MEKIKSSISQGIFCDQLAGKNLSEGETIHLMWADGTETDNIVHISEQHLGQHVTRKAYVEVEHRGTRVCVPLVGHLAERKTYREDVVKKQQKFDAAVEAVVVGVLAKAKATKKKAKRKTRKSRRRAK